MSSFERGNFEKELEFCTNLYPGFSEIEGIISAFYKAREKFAEENAEVINSAHISLEEKEVKQKLKQGEPLYPQVIVRKDLMQDFFEAVAGEISKQNDNLLKEELEEFKEQFLAEAFPASKKSFYFTPEKVSSLLQLPPDSSMDSDLGTFIITFVLSSLYQYLLEDVPREIDTELWQQGCCPVCGSSPHFGMLKDEGARYLECWLCATRWWFPRLQCPYCNNTDHDKMGYFTLKSEKQETKVQKLVEGICHINFCKACNSYIKVFDARACESEDMLLTLHNLATLSHDILARKEGFLPGSHLYWICNEELQQLAN